jgi:hypothetical protein
MERTLTTASLRSNAAARRLRRVSVTMLASVLAAGVPHHVRAQMPTYWGAAALGLGAFRAGEPYDPGVLFSGTFSLGRRIAGGAAVSLDGQLLSGPTAEQPRNYPDGPTVRPRAARTLPTTYGLTASGWRAVARRVMVGAGAGAYHIETRGGAPGGTGLGLHAAAERAVVAGHRGALTVGARVVYLPNIGGTSAWLLPVSVGVRAW